ncbi:MAG TPA: bifunctional UDP-N-acetylmuramoyl-tripeptide:D-alanyl-D-alanine ligase/alanine racemase [Edaphocola sp.]|nr:bifunctional UDP-N-acetylmuramoyl-tripeptide:D-alanyl-D-alanine ligase/alanine racemase [Edaphocola sp.]
MKITEIIKNLDHPTLSNHSFIDNEISELCIDSRKVTNADNALFFALKGVLKSGQSFINQAYTKGIRFFIIEEELNTLSFPGAVFIKVSNTLSALQKIGKTHREQFNYPVIGITGSNGKTIVKEWLYTLLSECFPYNEKAGPIRSPKSYNSQIGVPLSTWLMQANNTIGIFEAGISKPMEMEKIAAIIQPTIGIFTNIGEAHNEGFESIEEKIKEKIKLFTSSKQLIYCKDHEKIWASISKWAQLRIEANKPIQLFSWSTKDKTANVFISEINTNGVYTKVNFNFNQQQFFIEIPFKDKAYIEDALHCIACMLLLDTPITMIQQGVAKLLPVAMRLELVNGINNCTIINDTYNSDYTSLKIALDFLNQQKGYDKKTIILSDILEVRQDDETFYNKVGNLLQQKGINTLIGIGDKISNCEEMFSQFPNIKQSFYKDTNDFLNHFQEHQFANEIILIKGARSFEFEKIEQLLEEKTHKTILEVDLTALLNNIRVYKSLLKPGVKLMAMVKAFAYGTGSIEIANALQFEGVDYLTVAYLDEGIALRKAGISIPIMVMSPEFGAFNQMISWNIEPEIFSLNSLVQFLNIAKSLGTERYPIHLKLDTGMHRLGFSEEDLPIIIPLLQQSNSVSVKSIFSHLVGSDRVQFDDFTTQQKLRYINMSEQLMSALDNHPLRHLCNSAAISRFPNIHFDMVRLGIGMYGIDPNPAVQKRLSNVATLKTTIAQIKEVKAGETIGYSRRGIVDKDSKIATVSIGYADGYFRDFGNGVAYMLVNNQEAKTLGSICMDMTMIDITGIDNAQAGDKVIVFGKDLPVSRLAEWGKTIPYEIITSISQRVKRVYLNEE